jgi:hypothetical protein
MNRRISVIGFFLQRVSCRHLIAGLLLAGSLHAANVEVTLNGLRIELDGETGGILSLEYPKVGRMLSTEAGTASLVDLAFPLGDYVPLRLGTRHAKAEFDVKPDRVVITWPRLAPSRSDVKLPEGSAVASATLAAAPDGRSVILTCRIDNRFDVPIPQILFPDLEGLRPIGPAETTRLTMARGTVTPFTQRRESRHHGAVWWVGSGWHVYEATAYSYGPNAMSWFDYGSLQGGFSVYRRTWRDRDWRRPDILTYVSEREPERMRLCCWQPGAIAPGATWESPEFWLTPHEGGWAKGIEAYRAYIAEVNPPHEIPRRIREGLGYLSIWMSDGYEFVPERAEMRFRDLPAIARDAKAHGIDEMAVWRWCTHLEMPIHHRAVLGTAEEWLAAVKECRAIGVNVAGALGIHLLRYDQLPRYGVKYTARNAWNFHHDLIPNFNPSYLRGQPFDHAGQTVPPSNKLWQDDVVASVGEWIDRGLTSFTWDVYGGGGPDGPLSSRYEDYIGLIETTQRFRAHAKKIDPESSFNGETNSTSGLEWDGEALDYTWNWISTQVKEGHLTTTTYEEYVETAPIQNLLRSPRVNCIVESSPVALRKEFADGVYINFLLRKPDGENGSAILGEKPLLSPAVKQAAARRRQFLPYFTEGTPIGDCLLARPSPLFVRSHVRGRQALVVFVNDGDRPQRSDAAFNLALWLGAGEHRFRRYDADGQTIGEGVLRTEADGLAAFRGGDLAPGAMELVVIE